MGKTKPISQVPSDFFVHDQGICESKSVGRGTKVWAYAHVLPGAVIGRDCNICDHVFIENDVRVGDRVTVKCGVQLWDGIRLGNDVFVGPNATFSNDRFPRSKHRPEKFLETYVHDGASIGANATLLPGITIGARAMVGAGAVVTDSVPPMAIVVGNPARIVGYVDMVKPAPEAVSPEGERSKRDSKVKKAIFHRLPYVKDLRGNLSVGEFDKDIPFAAKRYFLVFGVPSDSVRGQHAHHKCHQFLVCTAGSCSIVLDDGKNREEFVLDSPHKGLYVPPMTWLTQYKHSKDCALLVFASDYYDPKDYIREYEEFMSLVG